MLARTRSRAGLLVSRGGGLLDCPALHFMNSELELSGDGSMCIVIARLIETDSFSLDGSDDRVLHEQSFHSNGAMYSCGRLIEAMRQVGAAWPPITCAHTHLWSRSLAARMHSVWNLTTKELASSSSQPFFTDSAKVVGLGNQMWRQCGRNALAVVRSQLRDSPHKSQGQVLAL